jgi:hypothetical protein
VAAVSVLVANAIVTAVQSLGLVPNASVAKRKTPSLPNGVDPPQIVVSVGEEGQVEALTARKNLVRYPVAVTIVTGGGKKLIDDETLRDWRGRIREAVDCEACFAGVDEFNQVDVAGKAPFNASALAKDLNYSVLLFTVQAIEPRS